MVTCMSCFFSFSLQLSQLWLHVLLFIVSHVRFFFPIFFGATITMLVACITHYCHLYRSFLFFSFLVFFFLVVTITIICIVHYDCLRFIYFLSQLQSHVFLL
jgi:hypothetical protein